MEFRADLHCHSSYSDGMLTPEEILYLAKEMGLQGIAITDHDTIEAYSKELFSLAKSLEIELLLGVEISSQWEGENVHILGYGFLLDSKRLQELLVEIQRRRSKRNEAILEKLAQKGMLIDEEELLAYVKKCNRGRLSTVGRPHIAALLQEKGYVSSYMQAFQLYLKDGGSCYVQAEKFSSSVVVEVLHEAKGKAILAHPHLIVRQRVVQSLLRLPFDGLEGDLLSLSTSENKWVRTAKEKGWIITRGSDFHGIERSYGALGCSWVNREVFEQLQPQKNIEKLPSCSN